MKKWLVAAVIVIVLIIFAFQYSKNDSSATISMQDNINPVVGGTMVIGISNDVDSFNPLFGESVSAQEITHLLLLGLVDLNEKSEFVPELASSWERSKDFKKISFTLRQDLVWSDGKPITAEDVQFTFDVLMDSTVGSPRRAYTEYIKNITVESPYKITFEFTEVYPDQLFDIGGEILPKHILENVERRSIRGHDFGRNPISSGPFKLSKWVSQQYIELVPNENYFEGRPYLDKVIFKIIPDKTNLLLEFETGKIDMMVGVPPAEVERLKNEKKNMEVHQISGRSYYYIAYNEKNELFSNRDIRRALTMSLDRQTIIKALLYGFGKPCLGPLSPIVKWAFNEDVDEIPFDPDKAKQIFAQNGWKDTDGDGWVDKGGKIFEFTLKTGTGNQIKSDVAVIAQEQWSKIGVKANIKTVEWTAFLDDLRAKKFDACINGWSTSFNVDPYPIFHSTATEIFNFISYSNPQVDQLIDSGRQQMDRQKAAEIWKDFQRKVYEDQPYTFLFWIDKVAVVNSKFKNVSPLPISSVYGIEKWYLIPESEI